jgi:membrane protein DedA with SNARE-associated domain
MDPIGSLIDGAAAYGQAGLFALALLDRLVPVIPSYGLFVAIGIGAAEGSWSVPAALAATVGGGMAGCMLFYGVGRWLGERRSLMLLRRSARLFGLSAARMDRLAAEFRHRQARLSFGTQLVPAIRLVTPAIAGLLGARPVPFALASLAGVVLWNGLFIGVGFLASHFDEGANASTLAVTVLVLLLAVEGGAVLAWRLLRRGRPVAGVQGEHAP